MNILLLVVCTGSTKNSFKVGEFSNDGIQSPNALAVKLLRSEILKTKREDGPMVEKNLFLHGA